MWTFCLYCYILISVESKSRVLGSLANVPSYLKGVIVGLIISDAHLRITKTSIQARLEFGQSINNIAYFYLVFQFLAPLCQSFFIWRVHKVKGTICYTVRFTTRALPFLTELYHLFYVNRIKVIPDCLS